MSALKIDDQPPVRLTQVERLTVNGTYDVKLEFCNGASTFEIDKITCRSTVPCDIKLMFLDKKDNILESLELRNKDRAEFLGIKVEVKPDFPVTLRIITNKETEVLAVISGKRVAA